MSLGVFRETGLGRQRSGSRRGRGGRECRGRGLGDGGRLLREGGRRGRGEGEGVAIHDLERSFPKR